MTRQKMFFRMITASLLRRRSRMLVALLAIAVGATLLSGLLTVYVDVPRQMGAQFRSYGANLLLTASGQGRFDLERVEAALGEIEARDLLGMTAFRYETLRVHEQPVVAAGTDLQSVGTTSPYWHVEGKWPEGEREILLGKKLAHLLGLAVGDSCNLSYSPQETEEPQKREGELSSGADVRVAGILDTGGSEEDYLYMDFKALHDLVGGEERLDLAELSISARQDKLQSYVERIARAVPEIRPSLVKRVTQSETAVLGKLQALVLLVTVVILLLTMISVATTMTAVVAERRREIGLRKALGASDRSLLWEFMGEGLFLGGLGGLLGTFLGFAFAQFVSARVFSSAIRFQPLLLPLTLLVSIFVTGLACLLPVRSAMEVDPALVLKGE